MLYLLICFSVDHKRTLSLDLFVSTLICMIAFSPIYVYRLPNVTIESPRIS